MRLTATLIRLRRVSVALATASAVDHLKMADEAKAPVVSATAATQPDTAACTSLARRVIPIDRSGNATPEKAKQPKVLGCVDAWSRCL